MKILVLAADARERGLIQSALEKNRHEVLSAASVEEGLHLIASGHPRLAIVDDDLPGTHRAEFITRVRAGGGTPIYLLSLSSTLQMPLDCDDTMHKPYTVAELVSRISLAQRFLALSDSLNEAREQIENVSMFDPLTGVLNQSAFLRIAQGELERARRAAAPLSVISLDLDNFRDLNNRYGITAGDEALRAVGSTTRERCRPYDCIGRWSGDEFAIALPGVIGEDAEKIALRIIKGVLSSEVLYQGQALPVGVSAGIASILQIHASTELEPLIEQARQARARAREKGGNQVFLTFA
ncbi:MAG TPA: diguanylate cyclase [Anaerolineales bacterium]